MRRRLFTVAATLSGTPLRLAFGITAFVIIGLVSLYAASVQRGKWGTREEYQWEVALSEYNPAHTRVFSDERMPEYRPPLGWLAPVFADIHAVDVRLRRTFWRERATPNFDDAPNFELVKEPPTFGPES